MIEYTVWYRMPGRLFWTKVKHVIGDGQLKELGLQFLVTKDDTLYRFPIQAEVRFSPERKAATAAQLSREAGQQVQLAS